MGRHEPQARNRRAAIRCPHRVDGPDQLGKVGPRATVDPASRPALLRHVREPRLGREVVAVAVDVLAEQRDLQIARRCQPARLVEHLVEGPAPLGPAAEWDDAVRAGLVAPVDDRQPRRNARFAADGARGDRIGAGAGQVIRRRDRDALDERRRRRPLGRRYPDMALAGPSPDGRRARPGPGPTRGRAVRRAPAPRPGAGRGPPPESAVGGRPDRAPGRHSPSVRSEARGWRSAGRRARPAGR